MKSHVAMLYRIQGLAFLGGSIIVLASSLPGYVDETAKFWARLISVSLLISSVCFLIMSYKHSHRKDVK